MKRLFAMTVITAILALTALAAGAETRYVSDRLTITLRTGAGAEFKIIDYLSTDEPVEVLSEQGDYMKVRTADGKEGWVRSRYITSEKPKSKVIASLTNEVERLKAESGDATELAAERERLMAENKRLVTENRQLQAEAQRTERREIFFWFFAGAGVLFIGWLIGRASRQKRYY